MRFGRVNTPGATLISRPIRSTLHAKIKRIPWADAPARRVTVTGHGRRVTRAIKVVDRASGSASPAPRRSPSAAAPSPVRATRASSRLPDHLRRPSRRATGHLRAWAQGHWGIENALHRVLDVTYDEDRSQVRTGNAPESWRPCATPPSACSASPAGPTSLRHSDITPETPHDLSTNC
jgi:hypothetical protein